MKTEILGDGEPEHAVVYHIHGDEPCGRKTVEKLKQSEYKLQKPLKLVLANERAAERNERYTEADLNRSFPGDPESDLYEERLAPQIIDELQGLKALNIHSTRSQPTPFGTLKDTDEGTLELAKATGVQRFALFEESAHSLESYIDSALIESGPQGTEKAAEQAYQVLLNFLGYHDIIDYDADTREPEIYRVFETVEGRGYEFFGSNFQKIEEGQKYAERDGEDVIAEQDFYPVLMSTDGYKDMLGFKAEKIQ
jgi:hypothetical protein